MLGTPGTLRGRQTGRSELSPERGSFQQGRPNQEDPPSQAFSLCLSWARGGAPALGGALARLPLSLPCRGARWAGRRQAGLLRPLPRALASQAEGQAGGQMVGREEGLPGRRADCQDRWWAGQGSGARPICSRPLVGLFSSTWGWIGRKPRGCSGPACWCAAGPLSWGSGPGTARDLAAPLGSLHMVCAHRAGGTPRSQVPGQGAWHTQERAAHHAGPVVLKSQPGAPERGFGRRGSAEGGVMLAGVRGQGAGQVGGREARDVLLRQWVIRGSQWCPEA